jgi:TonB family protein
MRLLLLCIFSLGLVAGLGTDQQQTKTEALRFDPPAVIRAAEAVYPLQSVVSGTVVLEAALDDQGTITNVRVVRGIPSLTESAERSIRQWKFRPAYLNGKPVASKMAVAFSFVPPIVGLRNPR